MTKWTLDTIKWERFDRTKLNPELVALIKAAALVEHNGHDYARYLCAVFKDEKDLHPVFRQWAEEEVQHGRALRAWAERADPTFDFDDSFARFSKGYQLPLDVAESVRGSRGGELIARCVVEIGTSSYYTAIKDATEEPVLQQICALIAADEFCHYKMFFDMSKSYLRRENVTGLQRLRIALGRVAESEDDELAYAFYAANDGRNAVYHHKTYKNMYLTRAFPLYRKNHIKRMTTMLMMAIDVKPRKWLQMITTQLAWAVLRLKLHVTRWMNPALA